MNCRLFLGQLHAKDESIREEAALCVKNLSKQCSDSAALEDIIEHLFAVLNGKLFCLFFCIEVVKWKLKHETVNRKDLFQQKLLFYNKSNYILSPKKIGSEGKLTVWTDRVGVLKGMAHKVRVFFKLREKPCYYLLIIYMTKLFRI